MNNRAVTLSLTMAVLAIFFVQSYVSSIEEEAQRKFGTEVLVISAKRDIKEMETIRENVLELKRVPKRFLEPAAIAYSDGNAEAATGDLKKLSGAIALVPIKEGEQISFNKLTEPSIRTGLAPQITPGKRAVSIPVSEITGVSKLVKPGDRADIISVLNVGGGAQNKIAKTLLQDVAVLSVGKYVTNNVPRVLEKRQNDERVQSLTQFDGFSTVTVEVDPMEAQMLALVLASGGSTLSLSLRNNDDTERTPVAPLKYVDFFQGIGGRGPASRR